MATKATPRSVLTWLLLGAWIVLGVVAIVWALNNAEDDLSDKAQAALDDAGIAAVVAFDGRDARLSGELDIVDQDRAVQLVRGITGVREAEWVTTQADAATTTLSTTPTTTTTTTTTVPVSTPVANLRAELRDGTLDLSGMIPGAETAGQIETIAGLVYAPFLSNDLQVDDTLTEQAWLPGSANAVALLTIVGNATLEISGNEATVVGEAGSEAKKAQLEGSLQAVLGPEVSLTSNIEVTNKTPPLYTADAPGDGSVTLGGVMPDQASIDLIADAAIAIYGADNVINGMTIGTDIDKTFSIFRIPLTFEQFRPIPEWELRIENDVITGNVRGGATFDFGSAELTPALRTLLDTAAGILLRNPSIAITIEGHTDSIGSDEFNQILSEARATAGVAYLITRGVPEARLTSVGYGETQPIGDNSTASGRQQNRRLEFVLGPAG